MGKTMNNPAIRTVGGLSYIPLSKGLEAVVDSESLHLVQGYKWCVNSRGYAVRNTPRVNGKRKTIYMHRLIAGTPQGLETDHINGNKLDNRISNLRHATTSQNQHNRGAPVTSPSGVKGVLWHSRLKKWRVRIKVQGREIHVGLFDSFETACVARQLAAERLCGEFAADAARQQAALNTCITAYDEVRRSLNNTQ
jgi:hypothetical protein